VTLIPVKYEYPIYTFYTILYILFEVPNLLEASLVVYLPVGSWFNSLVEWEATLYILVNKVVRALNDKKRREVPPFTINILNCRRPFLVTRLNYLTSSTSIGAYYYYRYRDNAY
jgi:hypothetical protein